jgi:hypothetical protein
MELVILRYLLRHFAANQPVRFLDAHLEMESVYLIVFTLVGGFFALFAQAGWSSYTDKKLPDYASLFRSFAGGIIAAGLASYAWIFGFQGDPTKLFEKVSQSLEVKETFEALTKAAQLAGSDSGSIASALSGGADTATAVTSAVKDTIEELKVGMPNF